MENKISPNEQVTERLAVGEALQFYSASQANKEESFLLFAHAAGEPCPTLTSFSEY